MRLTAIIPATDGAPTLPLCLSAIRGADEAPEQVIVVEDGSLRHPGLARNAGARQADGDVLVFIDSDVTVHEDAFVRLRRAFDSDPALVALFGSYDDQPAAPGVTSVFRNLLHHHVHQTGAGPASTFWAGLGAIRRRAFEATGGFADHPLEDIELGMRLARAGARMVLDPLLQGKHLKRWTVWSMVRTDLLIRGVPWVGLLLQYRDSASTSALNLGWRHRISAMASVVLVAAPWLGQAAAAAAALAVLVALNHSFYALLLRRQGPIRGLGGVALHVLHQLVTVAAVPLGILTYHSQRWKARAHPA